MNQQICIYIKSNNIKKLSEKIFERNPSNTNEIYLYYAVRNGYLLSTRYLLTVFDKTTIMNDQSLLQIASRNCRTAMVLMLIKEYNVDINYVDSLGENALHIACGSMFTHIIRILVSKQIKNIKNNQGYYPIDILIKAKIEHPNKNMMLNFLKNKGYTSESVSVSEVVSEIVSEVVSEVVSVSIAESESETVLS